MHLSRVVAVVGSAVALAAATVVPASAATHDPVPARQGAHWLEHQLGARHLFHNPNFGGFDDYGLSLDAALELGRLDGRRAASPIWNAVRANLAKYTTNAAYGYSGDVYAGSLAKALVASQVATGGAGNAGVLGDLEARVATAHPVTGRIEDAVDPDDPYGADYANVLGQALAARGLSVAHASQAPSVVAFLLDQQCSAGYFRLEFTSDKTSAAQSCDAAGGTADTDATAYAAIQLEAIPSPSAAVRAAIAHARSWLTAHQKGSGAWSGTGPTAAANANSTGLAAWALGNTPAARKAAVWLRKHQVRDASGCPTKLSKSRGAVAYDGAAMTAGRSHGITTATNDQWRRATTQALVGLTLLPRASHPIRVTTRSTTVRAHHTITAQVRHAAPYSDVCVRIGTHHVARSVGAHGRATVKLAVPGGRHHRALVVTDSDGRTDRVRLAVR